jgi:hypothetical protein
MSWSVIATRDDAPLFFGLLFLPNYLKFRDSFDVLGTTRRALEMNQSLQIHESTFEIEKFSHFGMGYQCLGCVTSRPGLRMPSLPIFRNMGMLY